MRLDHLLSKRKEIIAMCTAKCTASGLRSKLVKQDEVLRRVRTNGLVKLETFASFERSDKLVELRRKANVRLLS